MVSNNDIKEEFETFNTVWKFFKEVLPVHSRQDDAYWNDVIEQAGRICEEYPTELCKDFVLIILNELERRGKEHDSKITEQI